MQAIADRRAARLERRYRRRSRCFVETGLRRVNTCRSATSRWSSAHSTPRRRLHHIGRVVGLRPGARAGRHRWRAPVAEPFYAPPRRARSGSSDAGTSLPRTEGRRTSRTNCSRRRRPGPISPHRRSRAADAPRRDTHRADARHRRDDQREQDEIIRAPLEGVWSSKGGRAPARRPSSAPGRIPLVRPS